MGDDAAAPSVSDRRSFLKKAAAGGAAAGTAWVAPSILAPPAFAQLGSSTCDDVDPNAALGWNGPGYDTYPPPSGTNLTGWRTNGPGTNPSGPMDSAGGWPNHPTYTYALTYPAAPTTFTTTTGVTIDFFLLDTAYLNVVTNSSEAHGVSGTGTSAATWPSYRISKDGLPDPSGNPPVGQTLTLVIQFSELVYCPIIVLADVDNCIQTVAAQNQVGCLTSGLPTGIPTGLCSATSSGWSDTILASAWAALDEGGDERTIDVMAQTGTNILYSNSNGWWYAQACNSIPQTAGNTYSDLYLRARGSVREIRVTYRSNYQDPTNAGRQHIGLGPIWFTYVP